MAWQFQREYYSKRFRGVGGRAGQAEGPDRREVRAARDFVLAPASAPTCSSTASARPSDPEGLHLIAGMILDLIDDLVRRDGRPSTPSAARPSAPTRSSATSPASPGERARAGDLAARAGRAARPRRKRRVTWRRAPCAASFVRKATKDHGTGRVIENDIPKGSRGRHLRGRGHDRAPPSRRSPGPRRRPRSRRRRSPSSTASRAAMRSSPATATIPVQEERVRHLDRLTTGTSHDRGGSACAASC